MAVESTFSIEITGDSVFGRTFKDLTEKVFKVIRKMDPNVEVKEHHFARLGYRADWYGKPVHFEEIDNVQAAVEKIANMFLVKWRYTITVKYREVG